MLFDKIIIGAGLYGLYAAKKCGERGENVLVLEYDDAPFMRATYINQARVHMGYHYPRSYSTAIKSAHYFDRFNEDYSFCVHKKFRQIYATSTAFSWTSAEQFRQFCQSSGIMCQTLDVDEYFNSGMCDGAFLTEEYTYDAMILKQYFLDVLAKMPKVEIVFNARIKEIHKTATHFEIWLSNGIDVSTDYLLNATYASTNQLLKKIDGDYPPIKIKYELCEIILCDVAEAFKNIGFTVMDGPFFSIMPFGKTGLHSLTAVTFTPHITSYESLPAFDCQQKSHGYCSKIQLGNCNYCVAKPDSAWPYMSQMARKYLKPQYGFHYKESLFSMKPILQASEIDDSRPTIIRTLCNEPKLVSVLSGKINTVYDLDEVL